MRLPKGFGKMRGFEMNISVNNVVTCPVCGAEILSSNCSKFRVEGGEDEAKPFSILYEMTCPDCQTTINAERNYDFDRGLVGYAFSW